MAEPTPNESASKDEARPKLVAVERERESAPPAGATPASAASRPAETRSGSRWLVWLLAGLLVVTAVWAGLQSRDLQAAQQQNQALSEQVQGLEVQLSAATLQVQTYELREELVRSVATQLAEQVGRLQELVSPSPSPALEGPALPPVPGPSTP